MIVQVRQVRMVQGKPSLVALLRFGYVSGWFLPPGNNTGPTRQLNCLYTNKDTIGGFEAFFYSNGYFWLERIAIYLGLYRQPQNKDISNKHMKSYEQNGGS